MDNLLASIIAQSKNDELISKSSSGGIFAEIARYIISQGGVVFGSTIERVDDGFDVKHIYIEDENDIYKLQGSKYVQSKIGNTIKKTKEFLDNGKLVLFSGTPCQIAGLKTYLKKDYDNLITIDLTCEGTPSIEMFNDYIKYLEKNVVKAKIVDFKFRSKKYFGWSTSGFIAKFEHNGKIIERILPQNLSSYFTYFLNGTILQERCFSCKYSGLNRGGDITLADAWGIEAEYPMFLSIYNKNKGLSLVLINTIKGQNIYNHINKNIKSNIVNIKKLKKHNHPLRHPSLKLSYRDKILSEYKNKGYEGLEKCFKQDLGKKYYYFKIINYTPRWIKNIIKFFIQKKEKVDCLLYTMYAYPNYGSIMTAFSLQKAIEKQGYKTKLINYMDAYGYNKNFIKKYLKTTKPCRTLKQLKNLNHNSEVFILGSDNLINLNNINQIQNVAQALLNFTNPLKKRIMISGSMGSWDGVTKSREEHNYLKYLFNRFDYISTREEHGKLVLEKNFDVKADWINDPVFYIEKQDFIDLTKDVKQDYSNNIMQYILYPSKKTQDIVKYYEQETGLNIVKFEGNENVSYFSSYKNQSVENWLSAIINSKLIITDSFHCVAFSLIFNKPFLCLKNSHATIRFTSLFKRLGIDIQLIESIDDLKNINLDYDKEQVNKSIEDIRKNALDKIEQSLLVFKKEYVNNPEMEKNNEDFMKKNIPWYKKNDLFFLGIIVPFVIPIKRLMAIIKNEYYKNNK